MKTLPEQPSLFGADPLGVNVTGLDRRMGPDDAAVHDALCVLGAPTGTGRLSEFVTAAQYRVQRGAAFSPLETRRVVDRLIEAGHVQRDAQGRLTATAPHAQARFGAIMRNAESAARWYAAWRNMVNFDHVYSLSFLEAAPLIAAIRIVIFAGKELAPLQRLAELVRHDGMAWNSAVHRAVLWPFDAALFDLLNPSLQAELAEITMLSFSAFTEPRLKPMEDWLLRLPLSEPDAVAPALRLRLAETLLFRGQFDEARALVAQLAGGSVDLLRAALTMAQGQWAAGTVQFEAGLKTAAAALGRRKNLVSPGLSWLYLMALLASSDPGAWAKARKFAAAEGGGKRGAQVYGLWGSWQVAIDQRLGDAPKAHEDFVLEARPHLGMESLLYLHHLLLATWLRVQVPASARDKLRKHVLVLANGYDEQGMAWPAQLARRAQAALLGEPVPSDAMPFFVGEVQDGWRETLASVLALGAGTSAVRPVPGAAQDRLIWVVSTDVDGRLQALEAMEQKAGVRGLGKAKKVSLAGLLKRKDLPTHDAAMLRAAVSESYGGASLELGNAAPALVRHPHVAWQAAPEDFIAVEEALPGLEIMTQGEHIHFRLLDPIRTQRQQQLAEQDTLLPQRWREQRQRLRNILLLPDGANRARLVRLGAAQLRVAELVSQGWKIPVAAREELDAALRVLAQHFQVASDAEAGHEVPANAMLRAELTPVGESLQLQLLAAPFGDFGPRLGPGQGRERVTTVHQGVTLSARRDLAQEAAAAALLFDALEFLDDGSHDWLLDDAQQALEAVEALSQLQASIVTVWPKGKPMRVRKVDDHAVTLKAVSKGDWLALEGELTLDGAEVLRLRQLLELTQGSRSRYLALGDGEFLALSESLRQQLNDLAAVVQQQGQGQRLSPVAALAWQASATGLTLNGDAAWLKRAQTWAAAQEREVEPPVTLQAELRDYQMAGYRWLARLADSGFGAVLADDMGLGKTVQTLGLLLQRAEGGAALVVAPTSVCGNWLQEAARFAPSLQFMLYGEGLNADEPDEDSTNAQPEDSARRAQRRRQLRALGPGQVLVCSYALMQIDSDMITAIDWHSVVLDEAQAIKNPATRRAKAALALNSNFRLALTGTPIENRLAELWAIMGFCNPGLLGSAEQFTQRFANPIERDDDAPRKAQASRRLRRLLSPFLLRRTKAEVLTDLPPRTEIVHDVVPGSRERALLEALRQQAEQSVAQVMAATARGGGREGQNQFHVLAALTKLRRAACDPRLVAPELGLGGAKVQEFEQLARELVAGRHKALVFSQFTDFLALLRERLDAAGLSYQYLDGSTPMAERNKRVAAFQAGTGDLFLISLKAGGFGLNLTAADYVIITDPWWNPATEEQASARAHRMGQLRPVTVYRLVTQGSIEEKIVRLHRSKRDLAEGILSGEAGVDGGAPVDAAQLLELLREP